MNTTHLGTNKVLVALVAVAACVLMVAANLTFASPSHAASNGQFNYTVGSGNVTITGCAAGIHHCPVPFVIPSSIEGQPVTAIADGAFYDLLPDLTEVSRRITSVAIPNSVTSIGRLSFSNPFLTSITLGNSVTTIGYGAFQRTQLSSIAIPNSVTSIGDYAFYQVGTLTTATLGNSLSTIGQSAFGSTGLSSIAIPNSVTSIGDSAFYQAQSLTNVTLGNSVTTIGRSAFALTAESSITIPNSVTTIGHGAFYVPSLTSVNLGNSVSYIGNGAFQGTSLSTVSLPHSLTTLGVGAFWGSTLTSATFDNSPVAIGDNAFKQSKLSSISFGSSPQVRSIGNSAFESTDLVSVTVPNSVATIGTAAFRSCSQLTNVTLPSGLTTIAPDAFSRASLSAITIPSSVTSIGSGAFYLTELTNIIIPNSVTAIGDHALNSRRSMDVTFGSSVASIGDQAFSKPLGVVRFLGTSAPTLTGQPFTETGNGPFYRVASGSTWPTSISSGSGSHSVVQVDVPSITTQPASVTAASGTVSSLSVTADAHTGGGALSYQWKKGGVAIPNATSSTLPLGALNAESVGSYTVVVSGWAGSTTSNVATVAVQDGTSGPYSYRLNTGTPSTVSIVGCNGGCPSPLNIPNTITVNGVDLAVTAIAESAFSGATGFTHVTIPNNVTTIGDEAFKGITGLTTITFGAGLSTVGVNAFLNDPALADVKFMGSTGPSFAGTAFASSGSATFLRVTGTGWSPTLNGHTVSQVAAPTINTQPVSQSVSDGATVSLSVAADAHANGGTLSYQWYQNSVAISGETGTTLNLGAVSKGNNKAGIYSVTVTSWAGATTSSPATVSVTGGTSNGLTYTYGSDNSIIITGCVGGASSCPASLTIPDSINVLGTDYPVTIIDTNAFLGSTTITSLTIGANVTTIGLGAFRFIDGLTSLTIPNNVTTIGVSAFDQDHNVTSLTLGTGLTLIDTSAFSGLSGLTSLTIPDGVTTIGNGAFIGCTHLSTLVLGSGVTQIGVSAFATSPLATVRFTSTNGPTIGQAAFNTDSTALYRPAGGTNWPASSFNHPIVATTGPSFTAQPESASVPRGGASTLSVAVDENGGPVTFQWKRNGTDVPGATGASLNLTSVTSANAGDYTVVATNWAGSVESAVATVAVATGTALGLTYTVIAGTPNVVSITGCDGTCRPDMLLPSQVIYRDDLLQVTSLADGAFEDATGITNVRFMATSGLTFGIGTFANTGSQDFFRLSGGTGWASSVGGHAIVAVSAPTFTTQPASRAVDSGDNVTLTAVANAHNGGGTATYQWFKDGQEIDGETSDTLTLNSISNSDVGDYTVVANTWVGSTTSDVARVSINQPAPVTPAPTPQLPTPTASTKTNQAVVITLPSTLKKKAPYKLSASTKQGTKVLWKLQKNKFCSLKGVSLKCTKASGKQLITLTAQAPGSSTLNPFSTTIKRKVK